MILNGQIADNVVQMKDVDIRMLETPKERYFQLFQHSSSNLGVWRRKEPKLFAELEEGLFGE